MQCDPCPNLKKACWCELHPNKTVVQIKSAPDVKIKFELIKNAIAKRYNILKSELVSPSRKAHIVHARSIAFYVCRRATNATLAQIGEAFNKNGHSVVLHGINKIKNSRELLGEAKIIMMGVGI